MANPNQNNQVLLRFNFPNLVTGLRIVLTFIVIYVLLSNHRTTSTIAGIFLSLAWATDFIDGYLARRFHSVTEAGGVFDLVADRFLMITVLIITITLGYWARTTNFMLFNNPYLFAVSVLAADFVLLLGIIVFIIKRRKRKLIFPSAPYIARFTFSVQMATLVAGVFSFGPDWLLAGMMYLTILFTLISAYVYLKVGGYVFTR